MQLKKVYLYILSILCIYLIQIKGIHAQTVPWNIIIGANYHNLTSTQKSRVKHILSTEFCYQGCSNRILKCLNQSNPSKTARRLAGFVIRMVLQDRSNEEIHKAIQKRALSVITIKRATIKLDKNVPYLGSNNAIVKIVEYGDFECPYCKRISPILEKITKELQPNVKLYFKYFPVRGHKRAIATGLAGFAAWRQNKFWQMHDILYSHFKQYSDSDLLEYAAEIGLNLKRFQKDIQDPALKQILAEHKLEGLRNGVKGTPTIFINGKMYLGYKYYEELKDRIEEEIDIMNGIL